ncbi:CoA transferase [Rhodococcus sp. 1163]|uniref:CoA transferase n=1 Tax=Rhodococcus sp. 1163 TaxID=1905289 RepID=UPI000A05E952|nr:CoA transferase [Rhodococcus sp. 1163]ORI19446.1 CoA transferase [Rhodococcus sp. 1163]
MEVTTVQLLDDVRVVSLAINLPGPLAAARLAEFGAFVTKVEPPSGDPLAAVAPDWYRHLTHLQSVVTLDIKAERAKLDTLLADSDLLITSMRPSALARLGLARPQESFPRLCLIEIVGHDGDRADVPGHDLNYQAVHGTLSPPAMPKVPIADMLGAERAVSTALAALHGRNKTGVGASYRVVLEEAAQRAGDAVRHGLMGDGATLGGAFPGYGIYESADGFVALGAVEPHFFTRTLETFGVDGTHDQMRKAFADKTTAELEDIATQADIPLNGVK